MARKIINILIVFDLFGIGVFAVFFYVRFLSSSASSKDAQKIESSSKKEIDSLNAKVSDLTKKNGNLKTKVNELKTSISDQDISDKILNAVFWDKEGDFVADENAKFYTDMNCTKSAGKSLTFNTDIWLEFERANGYTLYIYHSKNGYVFSPNKTELQEKNTETN